MYKQFIVRNYRNVGFLYPFTNSYDNRIVFSRQILILDH